MRLTPKTPHPPRPACKSNFVLARHANFDLGLNQLSREGQANLAVRHNLLGERFLRGLGPCALDVAVGHFRWRHLCELGGRDLARHHSAVVKVFV